MATARRLRWLRIGAVAVLAFCLLPQIAYLGHWDEHEGPMTPQEVQEHAAHCHLGPSSCADGPGKAILQVPAAATALVALATLVLSLPRRRVLVPESPPRPPDKPPRVA